MQSVTFPADLPNTKGPPTFAPPPPPVLSWTGFYVGVNGGWLGSANSGITNTGTDTGLGGLGSAIAVGNIPSSISRSLDGGLVGGTIGYNWQFDTSFVVGIEGDLDWVDARNSTSVSPIVPPFAPATTTGFRALDWLGTIRGRVGFTPAPPILIYLTGGLAVGEHELGITAVGPTWGPPLGDVPGLDRHL
jgi:outer membrane immunogenic protein